MATVVNTQVVDRAGLTAYLEPRRDVVTEVAVGEGRFEAASGPVRDYLRTVRIDGTLDDDGASTVEVTETTNFRLAIPIWGPLFMLGYRREIRRVAGRDRARAPWWAPPDRMDERAATVLSLLCVVALVAGFLGTLLTQTITYAREEFGFSRAAQADTLSIVRVGVLVSFVLVAQADRRGRRQLLLWSTAASCGFAALGALSPNLLALGATQTVSRGLATTVTLLVTIIAAEEMPAGSRAYAVSVMTATGALGAGMCLWALPLADIGSHGWRLLYVLPLLFIPLIVYVGRRLPESLRFSTPHAEGTVVSGHGRRLWILGATFFLISVFAAPASQLLNDFLRTERHFSASRISLFTILTTTPGGIGLVVGGKMADVRGRRLIVTVGIIGGAALTAISFSTFGWPMWGWNVVGTILAAAATPALGMYGPELFPTGSRGRANGIIQLVSVTGSALGLFVAGRLSDHSSFSHAMRILVIAPILAGVLVLFTFPETAKRELEELNPEDLPPPVPA